MSKLISLLVFLAACAAVWFWVLRPVLAPGTIGAGTIPAIITHGTDIGGASQQDDALRAAASAQARTFLARWQRADYANMYTLLDQSSRHSITAKAFVKRYTAIAGEATLAGISYHVAAVTVAPPEATVTYTVHLTTTALGVIRQANAMQLQQEHGQWHIRWHPSLIIKELHDHQYIHMMTADPVRGAIYERMSQPLAVLGHKVRIDVVPGWINNQDQLVNFLSRFLHMSPAAVKARFPNYCQPNQPSQPVQCDWRWPIGYVRDTALTQAGAELTQQESNGIDADFKQTPLRVYPGGSLASALLGYVQNGHGQMGLEAVEDTALAGQPGLTLAVTDRPADDATVISTVSQRRATPGLDLHVTIDLALQRAAETALGTHKGAIVAIDPRDGSILALVSHPGFDPNAFSGFGISPETYAYWNDPAVRAFFNRATSGTYPLGSIFKIPSMAAALESGLYGEHAPLFTSTGTWTKLGWQYVKHDWLPGGHGQIDLHEALVQSCDDCFYDVGLGLAKRSPDALPAMGRAFGFGRPTGLQGLAEARGTMPGPAWKKRVLHQRWFTGDNVNLAIGQGYLLVTPLQVANMLAAVADGGVVHRPYLISSMTHADGTVVRRFAPVVAGHLPVSAAHLAAIRRAMAGVTSEPFGTAIGTFRNYQYAVEGKTGTAEAPGGGKPEAWFGAITPSSNPRLALAVLVENGGEGAVAAAPVARDVISAFYRYTDTPPKPQPTPLTVP